MAKIDSIGEVTKDKAELIEEINEIYSTASHDVQALVTNQAILMSAITDIEKLNKTEQPEQTPKKNTNISSEETGATVYRGKTGTKYHRQDCRTLKGGGIALTLEEAQSQGREACKICKP